MLISTLASPLCTDIDVMLHTRSLPVDSYSGLNPSSSSSVRSLSRRPSIEDVPEDPLQSPPPPPPARTRSSHRLGDGTLSGSTTPPGQAVPPYHPNASHASSASSRPQSPHSPRSPMHSEQNSNSNLNGEANRSPSTGRGRKGSRFSLSTMGSVLLDAVRSSPTRSRDREPRRRDSDRHVRREESPEVGASRGRGRERANVQLQPPHATAPLPDRGRASGPMSLLADILKQDHAHNHHHAEDGHHHDWKEFKKGK
jgi:hypothetical protein